MRIAAIVVWAIVLPLASMGALRARPVLLGASGNSDLQLFFGPHAIMFLQTRSDDAAVLPKLHGTDWGNFVKTREPSHTSNFGTIWLFQFRSIEAPLISGAGAVRFRILFISYIPWALFAAIVVLLELGQYTKRVAGKVLSARRLWKLQVRSLKLGELCPKCGYDLRSTEDRCPECGQEFERRVIVVPTALHAD